MKTPEEEGKEVEEEEVQSEVVPEENPKVSETPNSKNKKGRKETKKNK